MAIRKEKEKPGIKMIVPGFIGNKNLNYFYSDSGKSITSFFCFMAL